MAPSAQAHQRSHSMLLLQKLLNLRDSASPLTLIIDSLEQSAKPVLHEFITRAKLARSKVIFISLATVKKPPSADIFIKAHGKPLRDLSAEITSHLLQPPAPAPPQKYLLLLDTLHPLLPSPHLPTLLQSILPSPLVSLVAVYHADVPAPPAPSEYAPAPLTFLASLATTTVRVSSLAHEVAARRAQRRSLPVPGHGLREGREGVLVGLRGPAAAAAAKGVSVVLDVEMRRRSGRAVGERFVMTTATTGGGAAEFVLLGDHPLFAEVLDGGGGAGGDDGEEGAETTFSLGLTEKQRRDREGVVLPYFDAQTDVGGGEGGRILYDMGREDDFDEEEDEI
ncbi:Elongator complex protein 5 [Podospora conica]|nr:Elongator complex protein 5 [Schizothecium conicum]